MQKDWGNKRFDVNLQDYSETDRSTILGPTSEQLSTDKKEEKKK
jgi:hypothetical protein